MDPISALSHLTQHLAVLKRLPRTGWLQRGVPSPESVADHSFGVVTLALAVAPAIPAIDAGRLLAIAVVHDLAEAQVGDLPAAATRLFGREARVAAERRALADVTGGLPGGAQLLDLYEEYISGTSREARLVKLLDRVELLGQALAYERAGQRGLDEFWEGAAEGWGDEFPIARALALALIAMREQSSG